MLPMTTYATRPSLRSPNVRTPDARANGVVLDHGITIEPRPESLALREAVAKAIARSGGWASLDEIAALVVAEERDPYLGWDEQFRPRRAEIYEAIYHAHLRADPVFVCRSVLGGTEFGLRSVAGRAQRSISRSTSSAGRPTP